MNVSSATSVLPQSRPTPAVLSAANDRIEGNKPDNDGDKDDAVSPTSQVTNATGSVGTQINITA